MADLLRNVRNGKLDLERAHARTHARTYGRMVARVLAHTHAHARTHARTGASTHAHTHPELSRKFGCIALKQYQHTPMSTYACTNGCTHACP